MLSELVRNRLIDSFVEVFRLTLDLLVIIVNLGFFVCLLPQFFLHSLLHHVLCLFLLSLGFFNLLLLQHLLVFDVVLELGGEILLLLSLRLIISDFCRSCHECILLRLLLVSLSLASLIRPIIFKLLFGHGRKDLLLSCCLHLLALKEILDVFLHLTLFSLLLKNLLLLFSCFGLADLRLLVKGILIFALVGLLFFLEVSLLFVQFFLLEPDDSVPLVKVAFRQFRVVTILVLFNGIRSHGFLSKYWSTRTYA